MPLINSAEKPLRPLHYSCKSQRKALHTQISDFVYFFYMVAVKGNAVVLFCIGAERKVQAVLEVAKLVSWRHGGQQGSAGGHRGHLRADCSQPAGNEHVSTAEIVFKC